jgi:CBS-domain-containing membrane protein
MAKEQMVYQVMSKDIVSISEDATMRQAAELMSSKKIRHLPVTSPRGVIVGILSDRDLKRAQKALKINDFEQTVGSGENHLVKYYMNSPVLEVKASEPMGGVVRRMLGAKISCLVVVDDFSAPCGIVTTDDLLEYLAEVLENKDREPNGPIGSLFQLLKKPTYE